MALKFKTLAECPTTKARVSVVSLIHGDVNTPVFMPVGTQGTMKGVLPQQLQRINCQIILANTYHLAIRPGPTIMKDAGGLHKFMNWPRAILTDSGGFQMVSLSKLAEITEEGVKFISPYDESVCVLTPEKAIETQNIIGADIIMQLDDVVKTTTVGPRVKEAMNRTIRWLDRCLESHSRDDSQSVMPIVQGGLDPKLREICVSEIAKRKVRGFAIGGLSGGERKEDFCSTVNLCTDKLPKDKPRYLMGVGFATDLVVCVALGVDMFDCVFPTRTARFGCALTDEGQINLKHKKYALDMRPIDDDCDCTTCNTYTRSYLHFATAAPVANTALTVHNINYQMRLMRNMRTSIEEKRFPQFIKEFMRKQYPKGDIPGWIVEALNGVGVNLKE